MANHWMICVPIALICVLINISNAESASLTIANYSEKLDFYQYIFGSWKIPDVVNFSLLKDVDFCSANVIGHHKVRSPPGAIVTSGNCSIHEQLVKIQDSGYKYVIFVSKHGEQAITYIKNGRLLNLYVAIVNFNEWTHLLTSLANQKVNVVPISFSPSFRDGLILTCHHRIVQAIKLELLEFVYDFSYACIEDSIVASKGIVLSFSEVSTAVELSNILWEHDVADTAILISRWLTREALARTRSQLPVDPSQIESAAGYSQLLNAKITLVSLLFSMGDWVPARRIIAQNVNALCSISKWPTNSILQAAAGDYCQSSCAQAFVVAFSTLDVGPPVNEDYGKRYDDDWTVPVDSTESSQGVNILNPSAVDICVDILSGATAGGGDDILEAWRGLVMRPNFAKHPSLWLGASELAYFSQRYGLLNVMRFVAAVSRTLEKNGDDSGTPQTRHLSRFMTLLEDTASCRWERGASDSTGSGWCEDEAMFIYSDMPKSSQSFLRKNVKLGRTKSKHAFLLHKAGVEHLHRDMTNVFTKLGIYWDEYGSFGTSQRFFEGKLAVYMCQHVISTSARLTSISACSGIDSSVVSRQVSAMGCLFSKVVMGTPVIFSDSNEYLSFRSAQLASVNEVHSFLLPFLNRSTLVRNEVGRYRLSPESVEDLKDRYSLMCEDKKITITPAGMMLGYQFELQDMGDVAQAPSSPVAPSFSKMLETGNHIEQLCETGTDRPRAFVTPPTQRPTSSPSDTRLRVGFLSRYFYDHSVGRLIHSVILGLDPSRFDVKVFCVCCIDSEHSHDDAIRNSLLSSETVEWVDIVYGNDKHLSRFKCAHAFFSDPTVIEDALEKIHSSDLDILVYPEIGMDHLTMSFAMYRLATVQAVFWGHPISQGLQEIDYFISSELFDIHKPQCHLGTKRCPVGFFSSEQVVYMAGMTTHFRRPDKISDYGGEDPYESMSGLIPADSKKHVYLLPHTSMKFSTAMIRSLASILIKDRVAIVVILYEGDKRLWYEKLRRSIDSEVKRLHCKISASNSLEAFPQAMTQNDLECLSPACGVCCDCDDVSVLHSISRRLVMKTKVGRDKFYHLISYASVVLDTYPFGMGVTALETLAMGTPVVSLPSYQSVPSLVLGMLRKMELDHSMMVAHSPSEYVNNAIAIAASAQERGNIVAALEASVFKLYEDKEVVGEWETLLVNLHRTLSQS